MAQQSQKIKKATFIKTKKALVVIDFADFIVNNFPFYLVIGDGLLHLKNREILFRYSFIKFVFLHAITYPTILYI